MAEMNGLMLLQRRKGSTRDNSCEAVRETCTNAVGENMSLHIATARHKDVGTRHAAAADALYRPPRGSAIVTVSRSASDSESHAHRILIYVHTVHSQSLGIFTPRSLSVHGPSHGRSPKPPIGVVLNADNIYNYRQEQSMNRLADSYSDLPDRQNHARYIARWEEYCRHGAE